MRLIDHISLWRQDADFPGGSGDKARGQQSPSYEYLVCRFEALLM